MGALADSVLKAGGDVTGVEPVSYTHLYVSFSLVFALMG